MATVGEVQDAILNPATAADNLMVAAPGAGLYIKVLSIYCVNGATANSVTFKSDTTAKSPLIALAANGGFVLPFQEEGWFRCDQNAPLNVALTGATAVGVGIKYKICRG